ncbi:MAG: pyridoxamine 5'-phosphate oxidase family protein, partial [Thermomicrobiales bacterium]|nr:pyridoxamine 5'-phosphate oxidase family protein [Thermomicrobiales bacterium]MCO5226425.1 pyridoxamine 5'-phosphate oxidase family protein [Thermomicrobiales bacterium]MCO5227987.1 pyridoxamine 5'-phosphate oxidase family protein [Thermomicrobiales bacterium]
MLNAPICIYSHSGDPDRYELIWEDVEGELVLSQMYWITSLQDGIPHTVPVIGVWYEGALYSCNPRSERKYRNLKANPVCQALIGSSHLNKGLDVAVHGRAEEVTELEDRVRYAAQ